MFDSHIACPLDKWPDIPPALYHLTTANAKDTFYPAKQFYITTTTILFQAWLKKNQFKLSNATKTWHNFIDTEWPDHLTDAKHTYLCQDITQLRKTLADWIVHCEDHAPCKFVVYCPLLYKNLINNTFNNTDIFTKQQISPTHLQNIFPTLFPAHLKAQYSWGLQFAKPVATSYIFPKR